MEMEESLREEGTLAGNGMGTALLVHGLGGKPKFYKNRNANQLFHLIIILANEEHTSGWPLFPSALE